MNFVLKSLAVTALLVVGTSTIGTAQKTAINMDSVLNSLILKVFEGDMSRAQQLAVLDEALGEEFDIMGEFKRVLSDMKEDEKEQLMKFVYRKAGKPVPATTPVAKIYWKEVEYNFGVIQRGKVVKHTFEFVNIGDIPYEIEEIEGSCGCTVASYTKGVIPPGGKGKVDVTFDSSGKSGDNTELVTIVGNSHPARVVLLINVNVR